MVTAAADDAAVWAALAEVPDPEIPVVSVVDLGIVHRFERDGATLRVEILPTFVGCPAIAQIQDAIAQRLAPLAERVDVAVTYAVPWSSERITPDGRDKLERSGFAPPSSTGGGVLPLISVLPVAKCPFCGSRRTVLENAFGPTQCRAIHYCTECRQPFEQFKAV